MAEDLNLVALAPTDMASTQTALSEWCTRKTKALEAELEDLRDHLLIAVNNGWKLRSLQASINRATRRVTYYEKIRAAVDAGYLLVPNFPVRVLAVRVDRAKQPEQTAGYEYHTEFKRARPELLPAGEGRYVDETLLIRNDSYQEPDGKGGMKTVDRYVSTDYDEPDFPFAMVKPVVLAATQHAMALKVFDTIGMVENTASAGRDPIMVGQLLDPRGNGRRSTFFIAWWLNTADL